MKTSLLWLNILLLVLVTSVTVLIFLNENRWVVACLGTIAAVLAFTIFHNWMKIIAHVANQSGRLHRLSETYSVWSSKNFDAIQDNHNLVERKFKISAELIANLSREEGATEAESLIANDPIGQSLQKIRVEMKKLKEEEAQRMWINQGLAKFSDILRNKNELKEYCYQIISNLAKYMGANQGGLFVEGHDEDRYLELMGRYAYERRKHLESRILEGQGLLGQCMLEKDIIFMTDIPKDYIRITSGLGLATPRSIVVVPLMEKETFYGAIEIASFEVFKPFQLEFLKKVCENIAADIASIKNIQHTQKLLTESHQLTQELQAREEEMSQNMMELTSTQEEMGRKQAELTGILNAIDLTIATAEFDVAGTFKTANEIFLKVLGYHPDELKNTDFHFFMGDDHNTVMMWENLRLGKLFSGEFKMYDKSGKEMWLTGTFNPIVLGNNGAVKIMMFAQFTTQEKEKLNDLSEMVHAFKTAIPIAEFSENFTCKTANEKFLKLVGLNRLNLKSKTIIDFIDPYYHGAWKKRQSDLLNDGALTIRLPIKLTDHSVTYEVNLSPVHNLEGKISKVVMLLVREIDEIVPVLAVG
ncbi:MAG: PAS domain S-box protein [Cyclobacteriaceae bacterium]